MQKYNFIPLISRKSIGKLNLIKNYKDGCRLGKALSTIWGKLSEVLSVTQNKKEVSPMISLLRAVLSDPDAKDFLLQLYKTHERLMFAIVRKKVPDPYTREDIVQETVLKLAMKTDFLRTLDKQSLSAYVSAATRNTTYSYLRKRSMEETFLIPWTSDLENIPIREPSADEHLILQEKTQYFFRVWNDLSNEERFLLEGKYILQQSDQDLAKVFGCQPGSIRMKLTRLRRKVLKMIRALEEGAKAP